MSLARVALVALCAASAVLAAPTQVQFAVSFILHPNGNVNTATADSQILKTGVSEGGVSFQGQSQPQNAYLSWYSTLSSGPNNTWSEAGNITLMNTNGQEQGMFSFASFGNSGNIVPSIPGLPGVQVGGISYRTLHVDCMGERAVFAK